MSMAAEPQTGPAHAVSDPTPAEAGVAGSSNGHDMGNMVMLCAAMLAAAGALLLLTVGFRRTSRSWTPLSAAPASITRWATARTATGPPPVWEFSVVRC